MKELLAHGANIHAIDKVKTSLLNAIRCRQRVHAEACIQEYMSHQKSKLGNQSSLHRQKN